MPLEGYSLPRTPEGRSSLVPAPPWHYAGEFLVLEDNVLFYNFMKANPTAPIEIVPNVSLPEELILGYGYGYARYATRKEDCTLRAAYTQGLAELRGDGTISAILKKYGLNPLSNLIYFNPT